MSGAVRWDARHVRCCAVGCAPCLTCSRAGTPGVAQLRVSLPPPRLPSMPLQTQRVYTTAPPHVMPPQSCVYYSLLPNGFLLAQRVLGLRAAGSSE
eukprot:667297-Rhodomonas_salina.1